jgi:predicted  nucleic acid-binding Zn-ribbon protein
VCQVQLSNDVRLREAAKQQESSLERAGAEAQRLRDDCTARDAEIKQLRTAKDALESEVERRRDELS